MYSRAAAAKIKANFWTRFGQYMKPVANADGEMINWVNYKTGIKHVFFRLDADNKTAKIAIEIAHKDADAREYFYERFLDHKTVFEGEAGADWVWLDEQYNEQGNPVASIYKQLNNVNIFKEADWPLLISFLKENIVKLDAFWCLVKEGIE